MRAILLAIGAGLCWGVGEVCTRAVLHTHKIGPMTAVAMRSLIALPLIVGAWLIAWRVLHASSEPDGWTRMGAGNWTRLTLGSGVVAGGMAMVLFYWALSVGEVSRVKPIAFGIAPAAGVVLGALFLGETLTARKLVGVVLIILGVVAIGLSPSRREPTKPNGDAHAGPAMEANAHA
ncbi:MAG: DMT family transporter [Phycisphaerales bacterium]|jgi:drug/metabolite transporter (DMT)-like permease|nr:DMT family transporter [Phycisphaerales bacterium]